MKLIIGNLSGDIQVLLASPLGIKSGSVSDTWEMDHENLAGGIYCSFGTILQKAIWMISRYRQLRKNVSVETGTVARSRC